MNCWDLTSHCTTRGCPLSVSLSELVSWLKYFAQHNREEEEMINSMIFHVDQKSYWAALRTYLAALTQRTLKQFCLKQLSCSHSISNRALTSATLSLLFLSSTSYVLGRENTRISRRDLVIDLEDGLKTDAQFTYPAVGDGLFPGVVIVHGSGSVDMDGYISPEATGTGKPVRHYLLMAEYLSKRGFAVLRYNKRGVGLKGVTTNKEVVLNKTVQALERDVEKALLMLMRQGEVDKEDLTLIGRSEVPMHSLLGSPLGTRT